MSRLDAFLRSHSDMAIQDLLPALKEDLDKFAGNAPQFDDITMLCLEYKDRMIPADEESSGE
jgi:sigma-B regulation protein RsbU (phosphoserine phosphatase)